MFFLKLSVLFLLTAAPGLTFAENVVTCDSDVQRLICDSGLIKVRSAIYGRTDSITCSNGRPASQLQKTNCSQPTPQIAMRCDGQTVCEFKTNLIGSPDPCFGIYKYYNTIYDCIQGRTTVACENCYSTLDCGNDVIQIINANYGRTDLTTCSANQPTSWTQNINCLAPNTLSIVAARCNGRNRCTVEASYTIFTDPCFGTYKYLAVSYVCHPPSFQTTVTCEGGSTQLACGTGVLKIQSANYGRTDTTTCSAGRPNNEITKTNCYASNTLAEVKNRCEGKNTCNVPATNSVFSDPCVGTYKYLTTAYTCEI